MERCHKVDLVDYFNMPRSTIRTFLQKVARSQHDDNLSTHVDIT